jgi:hypothetical protein
MMTVKNGWDEYKKILPEDAPDIQISETQKSFYGGAMVMFQLFVAAGQEESPEACHNLWNAYHAEIEAFSEAVLVAKEGAIIK